MAYLCGSIPFGYLLVRIFRGQDVRQTGSGNIGATNVARTAPILGLLTLLLDALKGFAPVLVESHYGGFKAHVFSETAGSTEALQAWVAVAAVLGHMFPVWLKFRGGKGVATAVGAFLVIAPKALGFSLLVFLAVLAVFRYVSLASLLSAAAFPVFAYFFLHPSPWLLAGMIAVSLLIIAKHHANIRRLFAGTEPRFRQAASSNTGAQS